MRFRDALEHGGGTPGSQLKTNLQFCIRFFGFRARSVKAQRVDAMHQQGSPTTNSRRALDSRRGLSRRPAVSELQFSGGVLMRSYVHLHERWSSTGRLS
jgi:hypothetical protein